MARRGTGPGVPSSARMRTDASVRAVDDRQRLRRALGGVAIAVILLVCVGHAAIASDGLSPRVSAPYRPPAFVLETFDVGTRFALQSVSGSVAFDPSDPVRGERSVRMQSDGDGSQLNLRANGVGPFDLREVFLRVFLKVDDPERLEQALIYLSSDGFASYETYRLARGVGLDMPHLVPSAWSIVTVALGTPLTRGGPTNVDLGRVSDLQLSIVDTGNGPVSVWFAAVEAVALPSRGIVSLVFDDARDGVYHLARPLLERAGLRASVAVIVDLLGAPGFMSLSQLQHLERFAGWDVIAHHASALDDAFVGDDLDDDGWRDEFVRSKRWLLEQGFHRGADHLAYPYGYASADVIGLARRTFASGRTVERGLGLETWPPADAYRLRALSVRADDTPAALRAAIDRAANERSWLLLVFHQVVDGVPERETEYARDDLAAVIAHATAADVDIMTLPDVFERR